LIAFAALLIDSFPEIKRHCVQILQVNVGYKCNQACEHCHVDAGPNRKEMMDDFTISLIPKVIQKYNIKILDITGGAPELHPKFKDLVIEANNLNIEIIDRCNLTILSEPGYEYLANFLADNNVTITASLPCYIKENVDKQRGKGVFERSITGLKLLNSIGYGRKNSNLLLNLVFNPTGPNLPPDQNELEKSYKKELLEKYGIQFNNLLTIANMPIKRFSNYLKVTGQYIEYKDLLKSKFNPKTLPSVMCRESISVNWKGELFDCDFNQQLELCQREGPKNINDLLEEKYNFKGNKIAIGDHCFGCTAGSGSSCGGALDVN
tara:strand:+ start:1101 stop:2063 length:963 start_codon:yes stop_codon:yes gene_type:complete